MSDPLEDLRRRIDALDDEIIDRVVARFAIVREVAQRKRDLTVPVSQPGRRAQVREHFAEIGRRVTAREQFADAFAMLLIEESCALEREIADGSDGLKN